MKVGAAKKSFERIKCEKNNADKKCTREKTTTKWQREERVQGVEEEKVTSKKSILSYVLDFPVFFRQSEENFVGFICAPLQISSII